MIFVEIGRTLALIFLLSIFLGVLVTFSNNFPLIGKLPGDLYIRKWGFHFYLPITSAVIISLFLTWILGQFR